MLSIIKFGYGFVLPPGLWVFMLGLVSLWLWRKKGARRSAIGAGIMALLVYATSIPLVAGPFIRSLEESYTPPSSPSGDVIVVLTGGALSGFPPPANNVSTDGQTATAVKKEGRLSVAKGAFFMQSEGSLASATVARLVEAIRLYRQLDVPILVSGGAVFADSANEGELSRRMLQELGVPDSRILVENRSRNTHENAQNTSVLLREHGFRHPLLVTSAFHMPRAVREFRRAGVTVTPIRLPTRQMHKSASGSGS